MEDSHGGELPGQHLLVGTQLAGRGVSNRRACNMFGSLRVSCEKREICLALSKNGHAAVPVANGMPRTPRTFEHLVGPLEVANPGPQPHEKHESHALLEPRQRAGVEPRLTEDNDVSDGSGAVCHHVDQETVGCIG